MTTKQLVHSRNSLCCNSIRSDHFYPKIDTSPIKSCSDRKDRQTDTKIERDREREDNCVHKSACLVACQIGREGKRKTKNKKGVGDEKRDRDREDCGAVISERESIVSFCCCVSQQRERECKLTWNMTCRSVYMWLYCLAVDVWHCNLQSSV